MFLFTGTKDYLEGCLKDFFILKMLGSLLHIVTARVNGSVLFSVSHNMLSLLSMFSVSIMLLKMYLKFAQFLHQLSKPHFLLQVLPKVFRKIFFSN